MSDKGELPYADCLPYYVDQMYPHCSDSSGLREPNVVAAEVVTSPQERQAKARQQSTAEYVAWLLGESLDDRYLPS